MRGYRPRASRRVRVCVVCACVWVCVSVMRWVEDSVCGTHLHLSVQMHVTEHHSDVGSSTGRWWRNSSRFGVSVIVGVLGQSAVGIPFGEEVVVVGVVSAVAAAVAAAAVAAVVGGTFEETVAFRGDAEARTGGILTTFRLCHTHRRC